MIDSNKVANELVAVAKDLVAENLTEDEALFLNQEALEYFSENDDWNEVIDDKLKGLMGSLDAARLTERRIQRSSPEFKKDAAKIVAELNKLEASINVIQRDLGVAERLWVSIIQAMG